MCENNDIRKIQYPLTSYQHAIYINQKLFFDKPLYNIGGYCIFSGRLNPDIFCKALAELIARYDVHGIRLCFKDNQPYQVFSQPGDLKPDLIDFSREEYPEKKGIQWMHNDFGKCFALNNDLLFKYTLLKITQEKYFFYARYHHIIIDGWGIAVLFDAFAALYSAYAQNQSFEKPALPAYKNFISVNSEYLNSLLYRQDKQYWQEKSSKVPDPVFVYKTRSNDVIRGSKKSLKIKNTVYKELKKNLAVKKQTIFVYTLGVLALYLYKIYDNRTFIIGVPLLNRKTAFQKKTAGLFINTIPLFIQVDPAEPFGNLLKAVNSELRNSYKYRKLSLHEINNILLKNNAELRNIVEVCLSFEPHNYNAPFLNCKTQFKPLSSNYEAFPLLIHMREYKTGELLMDFDYQLRIFDDTFPVTAFQRHFRYLFESSIDEFDSTISGIDILSAREKEGILNSCGMHEELGAAPVVHNLFDATARSNPARIALQTGHLQVTYGQLYKKVNQLACYLRKTGVGPETLVALFLKRSTEMVIGILGIIKAGGAYLPVDVRSPVDRINFILNQSGVQYLLTLNAHKADINFTGTVINLDDEFLYRENGDNIRNLNTGTDLCYVIYTSGSTGNPKGVMIEHRSLVNRLVWMKNHFKVNEEDVILQKTHYTFDVSVWEILLPLICGARLYLMQPGTEQDPFYLYRIINEKQITILHFVPSMLFAFLNTGKFKLHFSKLRLCICSGEKLPEAYQKLFFRSIKQEVELYNLYGPTEAAIDVSFFKVRKKDKKVYIGKPVSNTMLYVLRDKKVLLPPGVKGELFISGVQVARGYLRNSALTAARFIADPFVPAERMYCTGDMCCFTEDGNIDYICRLDNQIKYKGYRIEPEEIESVILKHSGIREAAVILKEISMHSQSLVALYVSDNRIMPAELKQHCKKKLPDYMVPAFFIKSEKLPHMSSGKVDRKGLAQINILHEPGAIAAPATKIEKVVLRIVKEITGCMQLSVTDNFFESGGDSMKAIILVSTLQAKGYNVELKDVIENPAIRSLAAKITNLI